jgi:predicted transcriptional regulator
MTMKLEELKDIGLTEGEIKVYQALLEQGESTRGNLVKSSGISPSKIYDVTNRLIRKGIVASVKKEGVLRFSAAEPDRLKEFVLKKEQEIQREKELVDKIYPTLLALHERNKGETDVEVFYDWKGLKTAFLTLENSMTKGDESKVFGASIGKSPKQADIFFHKHQQRIEERGYKVRIIFNEDMRTRTQRHNYYDKSPLHEVKYLHTNTLTELYIYNEYVLLLMLLTKPVAIRIQGKEAVDSFKQFFETMWKEATQ